VSNNFFNEYNDLVKDLPRPEPKSGAYDTPPIEIDWGPSLVDFQLTANKAWMKNFGSDTMDPNDSNAEISILSTDSNAVHKNEYTNMLFKPNYGKDAPVHLIPSETSQMNLFTPLTKLMNRNIKEQDFTKYDFLVDNAFQAYRNAPIEVFNSLGIDTSEALEFDMASFGSQSEYDNFVKKHSISNITVLPNYKPSTQGYKEEDHTSLLYYGVCPRNNFMAMDCKRGEVIKNPNVAKTYVHHLPYLVMTPSYSQMVFRSFMYETYKEVSPDISLKEVIEFALKYHQFDDEYRKYVALAIEVAVITCIPKHPLKYVLGDRNTFHSTVKKMLEANKDLEYKYDFYNNQNRELFDFITRAFSTWFLPMDQRIGDIKAIRMNTNFDELFNNTLETAQSEYKAMVPNKTTLESGVEYTIEEVLTASTS